MRVYNGSHVFGVTRGAACGYADGGATDARFTAPAGLALASTGVIYVADAGNNGVRAVSVGAAADDDDLLASGAVAVTTLAGCVAAPGRIDAVGTNAAFNNPTGIAVDRPATSVFVADTGGQWIRKIAIATGAVTTLAGTGSAAYADGSAFFSRFSAPRGLALSVDGKFLFVADSGNHRIRSIGLTSGNVTTLAGCGATGSATCISGTDGAGSGAGFVAPYGVAVAPAGTPGAPLLYVVELAANRLRAIRLAAPSPAATTTPSTLASGRSARST